MRVDDNAAYRESRDCLAQDWTSFLENALPGARWLMVPNGLSDVRGYVEGWGLDGVVLTGGNDVGACLRRDRTESELLKWALDLELPVLGVCRGMQMMQSYLGGDLDVWPDRAHAGTTHAIDPVYDSPWARFATERVVNSFHNQVVLGEKVAASLRPFAMATGDVVEGLHHVSAPWVGVQWHPERSPRPESSDVALVRELFQSRR